MHPSQEPNPKCSGGLRAREQFSDFLFRRDGRGSKSDDGCHHHEGHEESSKGRPSSTFDGITRSVMKEHQAQHRVDGHKSSACSCETQVSVGSSNGSNGIITSSLGDNDNETTNDGAGARVFKRPPLQRGSSDSVVAKRERQSGPNPFAFF